ncbi:MAG TPA: T9SS type A sorting domain-containing protein, partial [Bacteroidia bacterium]
IDTAQIFVTGLSAGACMTNVMLACYPDVFSAGAVMAGAPYKAGANALYGFTTNTPTAWGDSVKTAYPTYTGSYPRVAVYQGSSDLVVSPVNETEIMKQWTNVHGASQTPAATISSFNGNPYVTKNIYNDASGNEVVETYTITGMSHGIALDTGSCYQKGGLVGTYAIQVGLFSSFWAAYFFHILNNNTININGLNTVTINQTGVTYSVTNTASTTYTWTVPTGATIASGQGTNQIAMNFATSSGNVSVIETNSVSCKVGPLNLYVTVGGTTGINQVGVMNDELKVYPNPASTIINVELRIKDAELIIRDFMGNVVKQSIIFNFKSIINVADLPAGVYILYLQEVGKATIVRKLIVH